jgi:hypothetical protein
MRTTGRVVADGRWAGRTGSQVHGRLAAVGPVAVLRCCTAQPAALGVRRGECGSDLRNAHVGGQGTSPPQATAVPRGSPLDLARMWHGELPIHRSTEVGRGRSYGVRTTTAELRLRPQGRQKCVCSDMGRDRGPPRPRRQSHPSAALHAPKRIPETGCRCDSRNEVPDRVTGQDLC